MIMFLTWTSSLALEFEVVAGGQPNEVGGGDPIEGGDEGKGHRCAELFDTATELGEHGDHAEYGAHDAEGGSVAAESLQHLDAEFVALFHNEKIDFEDGADLLGIGAVDDEPETLLEEFFFK
jgi:hypothetical protein